jgi:polysaccharide pyruvyl transferase WcaK-like protein
MPQIAVHGSYFTNNFGDTLLVRLTCDMVAGFVGRENVFLARPGKVVEQADIGYPVVAPDTIRRIDLLIFAGGGYFAEGSEPILRRWKASRRAHRRHLAWLPLYRHAEKAVIGVGVGPLTFPVMRRDVGRLFRSATRTLVRDRESFEFCQAYGFGRDVQQCVDLALSLPRTVGARAGVALHLPETSDAHMDVVLRSLAAFERGRYAEDLRIIYDGPHNPRSTFHERLQSRAETVLGRRLPVVFYADHRTLTEELAGYELVVTSKLHVGIVTIAQGGRAVAVPHHPKTRRLYRQLGLSAYCIEPARLGEAELGAALAALPRFEPDRGVIDSGVATIRTAVAELIGPTVSRPAQDAPPHRRGLIEVG